VLPTDTPGTVEVAIHYFSGRPASLACSLRTSEGEHGAAEYFLFCCRDLRILHGMAPWSLPYSVFADGGTAIPTLREARHKFTMDMLDPDRQGDPFPLPVNKLLMCGWDWEVVHSLVAEPGRDVAEHLYYYSGHRVRGMFDLLPGLRAAEGTDSYRGVPFHNFHARFTSFPFGPRREHGGDRAEVAVALRGRFGLDAGEYLHGTCDCAVRSINGRIQPFTTSTHVYGAGFYTTKDFIHAVEAASATCSGHRKEDSCRPPIPVVVVVARTDAMPMDQWSFAWSRLAWWMWMC